MSLGAALRKLFPEADPQRDYRVQDDGAGAYLAHWDEAVLGAPPTQARIDAVAEAPEVPAAVTNYQARAALIAAGLFDAVQTAVAACGPSSIEWQAWEYANHFYRASPFIASIGTVLELTDAEIDALFVAAAATG